MAEPGWFNDNANRYFPFVPPSATPNAAVKAALQAVLDFGVIVGPNSQFVDGTDIVYLSQVSRSGTVFTFEFASTATGLAGQLLSFSRDMSTTNYETEFISELNSFTAAHDSLSVSTSSENPSSCSELFLWQAFMATGDLSNLAAVLSDHSTLVGDETLQVLPELVRNLSQAYVTTINLANSDRTRATSPDGCPAIEWPYPTGITYIDAQCIQGDVRFLPGYSAVITQDDFNNILTIGAFAGAGLGFPCEQIPLFPSEVPPAGSPYLDGAQGCAGIVATINGAGGTNMTLIAGKGVTITTDPASNQILVDMNMSQLSTCVTVESEQV